jgi:hypothetical protein
MKQLQTSEGQGGSVSDGMPPEPLQALTPFQRRQRMKWAQLIRKVWATDPLLCPDCGAQMRILSVLTDPPVVDRILRHVGWRPGQPAPDLIRAPPPVPKVGESPS